MYSSSPSLATVRSELSLGNVNEAVHGHVSITAQSYVAPGGDYCFPCFNHSYGCQHAFNVCFETSVSRTIAAAVPYTLKEVEKMVQGILRTTGCSAACGLNKDTSTGLFLRQLSDYHSVYTQSLFLSATPQHLPGNFKAVIPESYFVPVQDDGSFETPAGALSSKPGTPSPDLTTIFGPKSFAHVPAAVESSSSARSFLAATSSGERRLYQSSASGKRGFVQDRVSDDDWVLPALRAGPSRQRRARSLSRTKKIGPLVGLATRDRNKKQVVPDPSLPALSLSPRIPTLALLSTIPATHGVD